MVKTNLFQSLQSVCLNLSRAFVNFFEKRARYPRFKSRHGKQSLIYPQNVKLAKSKFYFPKLDWIDAVIHRPIEGAIRTVTISKNCAEQYYASVMFEDGKEKPKPNIKGKVIGLDLGLTHFCITVIPKSSIILDGLKNMNETLKLNNNSYLENKKVAIIETNLDSK